MTEIERIAKLYRQAFEGSPYYGPATLEVLHGIPAELAARKPAGSPHSIWELVNHLAAEMEYAREVLNGSAGPWVEGATTWPPITTITGLAWQQALDELKASNRALVRAIQKLDDTVLETKPPKVRGPYYLMLHGTLQHLIYHTGQISLLAGQARSVEE